VIPLALVLTIVAVVAVAATLLRGRPAAVDPLAEDAREACLTKMAETLDEPSSAKWDYKTTPRRVGENYYRWQTRVESETVGSVVVSTPFTCEWQDGVATVGLYGRTTSR
jgi:hypothetical protein